MENILIYSRYVPAKAATEYALFVTHEGKSGRANFEFADEAGFTEEDSVSFLLDYTYNELQNPEVVAGLADFTTVEERDARAEIFAAERGLERRKDLET